MRNPLYSPSVSVWPQVLEKGFVVLRTVGVARAGPDQHHWFPDELSWEAFEVHRHGSGVVGSTAATITAHTTEPGFVGVQARAVVKM